MKMTPIQTRPMDSHEHNAPRDLSANPSAVDAGWCPGGDMYMLNPQNSQTACANLPSTTQRLAPLPPQAARANPPNTTQPHQPLPPPAVFGSRAWDYMGLGAFVYTTSQARRLPSEMLAVLQGARGGRPRLMVAPTVTALVTTAGLLATRAALINADQLRREGH